MTTTDYLINAAFVLVVLRQAHERKLDPRYYLPPLAIVTWVATQYIHSLPSGGGDIYLIGALITVGVASGTVSGFATHLRADNEGTGYARLGWLAGGLLIAGISSRMLFVWFVQNGGEATVRSFSAAHHISAAAWPFALVMMGLCEVAARIVVVYLRSRTLAPQTPSAAIAAA
jgi:hypothetical protein